MESRANNLIPLVQNLQAVQNFIYISRKTEVFRCQFFNNTLLLHDMEAYTIYAIDQ